MPTPATEPKTYYRCDNGCEVYTSRDYYGEDCTECAGGKLTAITTEEQFQRAVEQSQIDDSTLDLVSILGTFKAALEELNNRVVALEDSVFPPAEDEDAASDAEADPATTL